MASRRTMTPSPSSWATSRTEMRWRLSLPSELRVEIEQFTLHAHARNLAQAHATVQAYLAAPNHSDARALIRRFMTPRLLA
eukprot:2625125-Pleurochrysis_carterae.AAC.1